MTIEEQVMEVREKQAFWQGVVRGVIGSAVFFAGLVTLIYYIVQIVDAPEMSVIKEKPLSCGAERLWVSSVGTDRDLMIVCRNHRCTVYQI